jgi:hypothetical protein
MAAIAFRLDVPARFLDVHGQRAGFVLLASFLLSFLFIRTSARMNRSPRFAWWPGSVTTGGGLHLHHLVWGIVLVLLTGFVNFATQPASPWSEFLAAGFGIGAGFTLDEFALWIYLRDVYWTEEGRSSFDAVVVATLIGGLIVLGFAPFDLSNDGTSVGSWAVIVIADVLLGALAILKGKPLMGLVGIFIPFVSFVGASRLGAPGSWWGRRFYSKDGRKLARSQRRWERVEARRHRIANAIAGAPGLPVHVSVPDPAAHTIPSAPAVSDAAAGHTLRSDDPQTRS